MKILAFFLFTSFVLNAQFYDQFDCPVNVNGRELAYPFTGGFSNPQFSEFDLNNDGKLDLFIFDRQGNSSMVLLRNDSGSLHPFTLTKAFNRYLPLSLDNFCLLNDFNNDGVVDLFTSGVPIGLAGIMLFQGSKEDDKYDFRVRRMGRPDGWQNGLWNKLNDAQVYVAPTDLPAIIDVDFDGDLDILSFDSGGSYMVYNRNFQVELGLSQDTMDLRIDDFCFGKFEESGLSQTIALSDNPALCAFSPVPFSDPN
ncbi:MAG: VCBS repeat-containing protein, partial [Bacteroidia bacterium]|nr:VCBS repeat-containing protein [Bacteroidia bacterium]